MYILEVFGLPANSPEAASRALCISIAVLRQC